MMRVLVWGAPGLPEHTATTRGWTQVKKRFRTVSAIVIALTALATIGLFVPAASAADLELRFVDPDGPATGQPQDAEVNQTIRTADLNVGSAFVQIEVVDAVTKARITNFSKPIGFVLNAADGFATGNVLDVIPQVPVNGVAEFGAGTLSIDTENEPQFTDYSLIPVTTRGPSVTGLPSEGFDVWEDGESCSAGETCEANLRGGNDHYTLSAAGTLGASELTSGELPGLVCAGQQTVFANSVFSYATTGTNTPVYLENHITKADWRASANNGQAHADWCIGLPTNAPWIANGANSTQLDTDLDGDLDLYVALAPKCPVANPFDFAPCIVSQKSDGKGGSITLGWLTAGDPPRRT
jgi:hypothetical protein